MSRLIGLCSYRRFSSPPLGLFYSLDSQGVVILDFTIVGIHVDCVICYIAASSYEATCFAQASHQHSPLQGYIHRETLTSISRLLMILAVASVQAWMFI